MFFLHLMLFPTFRKKFIFLEILKSAPSNGWFLQIVDIGNFNMKLGGRWFPARIVDSGNLYPIYILKKLWC